jgi:hypothetical protein
MSSAKKNIHKSISGKKILSGEDHESALPKKIVFHADANQTEFLKKAGKKSAEQAIREAQALGLEIMYIEDGILYREKDGKREVVEAEKTSNTRLKKGTTLYVKK